MLASCDKGCKKSFKLNKFKERKLENGVIETYFKCPYCHKEYTCFYTDKEIRGLQAKLRNMWGKAPREEIEAMQLELKTK